jgi:hypothetical protein
MGHKLRLILITLVCMAGSGIAGYHVAENTEPVVITQTEYVTLPPQVIEKPVYIEAEVIKEVEKPVYLDREVIEEVEIEVPVQLEDWESSDELKAFLAGDDTDKHIILSADENGVIKFNGQCEDFAFQLRDRAMAQGKYLSVISLNPHEYLKWYGKSVGSLEYHAICMARIGDELWYVEPSNDRYWLALHLD